MSGEIEKIPDGAICGNCGQRRDKHHFEREIYCFENTNGDLWTDDPRWEDIGAMIEYSRPTLWAELVLKWKRDNGHIIPAPAELNPITK